MRATIRPPLVLGLFVVLEALSLAEDRARDPERAAQTLEKLGGWIDRDPDTPGNPVVGVRFGGRKPTVQVAVFDKELECLQGLPTLERAYLCGPIFTDAGVKHLRGLFRLRELSLSNSRITDRGLRHLEGLTRLRQLDLQGTPIKAKGLAHLKAMNRLRYLDLEGTQITDRGLSHLKGLARLRTLRLGHTGVTDAGVRKLQKTLPKLKAVR